MKKSLKIVSGVLVALLVAVLGLLAGAHFSDGSFEGTVEKKLMYEDSDIWPVLTDVEDLPSRRAEILEVEVLERDANGPLRWKEHTDMGGYALFERWRYDENNQYTVKMTESSFGMTGIWTYELDRLDKFETIVRISEQSEIDSLWVKLAMMFAGRDKNLDLEMQYLEEALEKSVE